MFGFATFDMFGTLDYYIFVIEAGKILGFKWSMSLTKRKISKIGGSSDFVLLIKMSYFL